MSDDFLSFYKNLLDSLPDLVLGLDEALQIVYANRAVWLLGYSPQELAGQSLGLLLEESAWSRLKNTIAQQDLLNPQRASLKNLEPVALPLLEPFEIFLMPKPDTASGSHSIYGELYLCPVLATSKDEPNGQVRLVAILRNVTQRRRAEDFLRKLLWALDQTPLSVIIADANGTIEYINPYFIRTTGFSPDTILGQKVSVLKSGYYPEEFYKRISQALAENGEWSGELVNLKKDGTYYWTAALISVVRNPQGAISHYIAIQDDITERKRTAERLKSLQEKEIMLREIHHRVKNNLQIITSLLSLQRSLLASEEFSKVFQKCENRIKTMALIHEKLYQSPDLAHIEFGEYLRALIFYLHQAYRELLEKIQIELNTVPVYLDINTALPAGLIVNELVTNAIFHAFPSQNDGHIWLSLKAKENQCLIEIGDNGHGFEELARFLKSNKKESLGLQLVRVLAKQLHATLKVEKKNGTIFKLIIPLSK